MDETHWFLDIPIANYRGAGRFVIGFANDIEIIGPNVLIEYVQDFTKQHLSKV